MILGNVIVTCGPGSEPIDEVRRITNMSTGQLGLQLTKSLLKAGFRVYCFRSLDAAVPEQEFLSTGKEIGAENLIMLPFRTNSELVAGLHSIRKSVSINAFFHAAALCDFSVFSVFDQAGAKLDLTKLSSRAGELTIRLRPTTKVIQSLREWFPSSRIVGWKFELDGTQADVIERGFQQIKECRTDACILNGRAYGPNFGFYRVGEELIDCKDGAELSDFLAVWLKNDLKKDQLKIKLRQGA